MRDQAIINLEAQWKALMGHASAAIDRVYNKRFGAYGSIEPYQEHKKAHPELNAKAEREGKLLTLAARGFMRGTTTIDKLRQKLQAWQSAEIKLWTAL